MLRPLLLTTLLLGTFLLAAAPTASADHCAQYSLVVEARCEANHVTSPWVAFVLCFYNTAPSQWTPDCISIEPW